MGENPARESQFRARSEEWPFHRWEEGREWKGRFGLGGVRYRSSVGTTFNYSVANRNRFFLSRGKPSLLGVVEKPLTL